MTTRNPRKTKGNLSLSVLTLAVAAALHSAPALAQFVEGGPVTNPLTGASETIQLILEDPVLSVRTLQGNVIWIGPTAVNATFSVTYRAAVYAEDHVTLLIPERPAGTYRITAAPVAASGRVEEISYQLVTTGSPPPTPPPPITTATAYYVGTGTVAVPGRGAGSVFPPAPSSGVPNQWVDRQAGRFGDNGADGWGVEICIISCWTIGDDADGGGPGLQGPSLIYSINTAPIDMPATATGQHGIWVSSRGGNGGQGGDAYGIMRAARGGTAGRGGTVDITVNTDVLTRGGDTYGVFAQSRAGAAGDGGSGYGISTPGSGGAPAEGGDAAVTNNARIETLGVGSIGVYSQSLGGGGGNSGDSYGLVGFPGYGSEGGNGGTATLTNHGIVLTHGTVAHGLYAQSVGGSGGDAGTSGGLAGLAGNGASGGDGRRAAVTNDGIVVTEGNWAHGIVAQSLGGGGGNGGDSAGIGAIGGAGSSGGNGGTVFVNNDWVNATRFGQIETWGIGSFGILAESIGGGGGNGGSSGGFVGIGGTGTQGGRGEQVQVLNDGVIVTHGSYAHGILAHSIGGGGGAGGNGNGLVGIGGNSTSSTTLPSNGGEVLVDNQIHGVIHTFSRDSSGILAQSIGGGGGAGAGSGGLASLGGTGAGGGNGTHVRVTNDGQIITEGRDSRGIVAQSIGGGGGSASNSGGAVEIGGSGGGGGDGGWVEVFNRNVISTAGIGSDAIVAQSIGGGGGNGASSDGAVGIGGSGTGGGNGGEVDVTNTASIYTLGHRARGVVAESIGGGGGNGGDGGGLVSIGGDAGPGGAIGANPDIGARVDVVNSGLISTRGNQATAIEARSVGGGGGTGGSTGGAFMTIGGRGGAGGAGGEVHIDNDRSLSTRGNDSHGIYAQSVGGGGGNGGSATSVSAFGGAAVGGTGGAASNGALVQISGGLDNLGNPLANTPLIQTEGDRAKGVFAQSVGGGGGNGGFAAQVTVGYGLGASMGIGGNGGAAGNGGTVDVDGRQNILTSGLDADGMLIQSVGGGGGNGGFAVTFAGAAGDVGSGSLSAAVGGAGAAGGIGGDVDIDAGGSISTTGNLSEGIVAQSIGGGGGTGGFAIALSAAIAGGGAGSVSAAIGGGGGVGGAAGRVDLDYTGAIATAGNDAAGVLSQAVGGGGGNGGYTISGAVAGAAGGAGAVAVGVAGTGGGGGAGGVVLSTVNGNLSTSGDRSTGLVAQSIGGRGGNGGFNVSGSIAGAGAGAGGVAVGIGGAGGGGGNGSTAQGTLNGSAFTTGTDSDAVLVQSVGGGGGNGGFNVSAAVSAAGTGSGAVSVGIGGSGGNAGAGQLARGTVTGNLSTDGDGSSGLVVQSVGGGGGNGGFNVSGVLSAAGAGSGGVAVGLGGSGGGGGSGGVVEATVTGNTHTRGHNATGLVAQSIGGGGGNGGFDVSAAVSAAGSASGAAAVGLGGSGGSGGSSNQTTLAVTGNVVTEGGNSGGVLAQSVGGGGGNGGFSVAGALSASGSASGAVGVGLGGSGGTGARVGGAVLATVTGDVLTLGDNSTGLTVQSIGGGGGNGGFAVTGTVSGSGGTSGAVSVGLGGSGGSGGNAALADGRLIGNLQTEGINSDGVLVQSVGGGGGNGGFTVAGSLSGAGSASGAVTVGLGGAGGGAGSGGESRANIRGDVLTRGDNASAIIAQSVGGGGGSGGFSVVGSVSGSGSGALGVSVGLGGSGGGGGNGGVVTAMVEGDSFTEGRNATAVIVQSVGGGGGAGGMNVTGSVSGGNSGAGAVAVGLGGSGGSGGNSALTTLTMTGNVSTSGDGSGGILVQSVGGGGGAGGMNVSGALAGAAQGAGAVAVGLGGSGGSGGDGEEVHASVTGDVTTEGDGANGYVAQSLGGGGGAGGMNVTGTLSASGQGTGSVAVGLGGAGGGGGDGRAVLASLTGDLTTVGEESIGALFQSVGGGGGSGGMNVTAAVSASNSGAGSLAVGIGGAGGGGGDSSSVTGSVTGVTRTAGDRSIGVLLQSVGGGGGNGGMNISGALSLSKGAGGAVAVGVGGLGGAGGDAGAVFGLVDGDVLTTGESAIGVLAQSIGGGGGNGGMNISGAVSLAKEAAAAAGVGVGGFAGGGGDAGSVLLARTGATVTRGANSDGVVAQSIGGGGGNGGMNISGALTGTTSGTAFSAALGVGGFGGGGGNAGAVQASVTGDIRATGYERIDYTVDDNVVRRSIVNGSNGVLAQSVGGGGGNGGMNISGGIALASSSQGHAYALNLGVGGFGGVGGNAGDVRLDVDTDLVESLGDRRFGIGAQSIGGGGGNGGMNISGGIVMDGQITGGIGGFGGTGGVAGNVIANALTDISATGAGAIGFMAQSVGGDGGNGALNISGGLQASRDSQTPSLIFGIGGFGGAGNISGGVDAAQRGDIEVSGSDAVGILAQSIAGGGGNGGLNVSGNVALGRGYTATLGLGGQGGSGANAGDVSLVSDGNVFVDGREIAGPSQVPGYDPDAFELANAEFRERANGILVQSIGGGGGNGGMNVSGVVAQNGNPITAGVGGTGSGGGDAGAVSVSRGVHLAGLLETAGNNANGLTAQSIGGGGGSAGMNFMFSTTGAATANRPVNALMLGVGGDGGAPGHGNEVDVQHRGDILTHGDNSYGLFAQSVGGGGGSATYNIGLGNNKDAKVVNIAVGGAPGDGGNGGDVAVDHTGDITTVGDVSTAIMAQSVGGGGGSTGTDMVTSPRSAKGMDIALGRAGGIGGTAGNVFVSSDGNIRTHGDRSLGIRAQSVGNGGGDSSSSSVELSGEGNGEEGQDWSASLEVGIEGGLGGASGDVEVHADGSIITDGLASHGIHAQSVGGGGGVGGALERHGVMEAANQVSIGVGGSGGTGGTAGDVSVDNDADIQTTGDDSHGVFAQSIGGGGGQGGYVAQLDLETGSNTGGSVMSLQMGGTGGTGSTAGAVNVFNGGNIVTMGRRSMGIDAQSTGGGGGEGGAIMSFGITRGEQTRNVTVNLGGEGGDGGTGDEVIVTNEGRIATQGDDSIGIRAQSVGGKGGDAGVMLELGVLALSSNQSATNIAIKVGGDGGTGGAAGNVEVLNEGIVTTEGRAAHGVFAQSIGGGGGNGSSIITANIGASAQGQATLVNLSVGGDGGTGGVAGDVTVNNESIIETAGEEAHGVFAQSVGGGGGNGGLVIAANAVLATGGSPTDAMLTLGGSGGAGNDAGDVVVDNSGQILTHGARSHGIFAQSIGGGGGNAGVGFGASTNPSTSVIAGTLSAVFGGEGGAGGRGGNVTVNHSGNITVLGENSQAVVAESINGGGGHLALDFNGVTSLPGVPDEVYNGIPLPSGTETDTVIEFSGGGRGQSDSSAGVVTLNYTGTFGVAGNNGAANAVQAIGGGGGTFDLTLGLNDIASDADDVAIHGRLGGENGANNRGGDIESTHEGDLVTEGDNTPGALVQSVGGGGGRANLMLTSQHSSIGATTLDLGGVNGDHEEGGDISHVQNGSVSTTGASAHGGVFQSIGGGGGSLSLLADVGTQGAPLSRIEKSSRIEKLARGAAGASMRAAELQPQLGFGSQGGTQLSGGIVNLELDGNVDTSGDSSLGLLFQSIGAGGGVANVLGVDGLSVRLGGAGGASGNGGDLTVFNTGDVRTEGRRAHGVFLQSIGGGGSAVFTDADDTRVTLSAANIGNGGNLEFTQFGRIATLGDDSYSVFAQTVAGGGGFIDGAFAGSAGGAGAAGSIDLLLDGDIVALGDRSTALFAQSTGAAGVGGDITAALSAGHQLVGGENGVAVYFDGGAVNSFTNRGTVRTLSGPTGFAFRGGAGGDFIDNFGTVMGNVDLGGGTNRFANNAGASFYTGTTLNLGGAANVFRNDGIIAPGADHLVVHTRLNGSFLQSATGVSNFELDLSSLEVDRITATGTASVGGTVNLSLFNVQDIRPGLRFLPLFSTSGGATNTGVTFNPQQSIVVRYELSQHNPNVLGANYTVDFAADGLQGNRVAVGEYLNRVQLNGGPRDLGDTITAAVLETDLGDYAAMLTQLGTEFYAEQQALALTGTQRFARNLQDCGTTSLAETAGDESGCYWIRYDDNPSTRDSRAGFPAEEDSSFSISQGVQVQRDSGWAWGFGFDYEEHRSSGYDGLWASDSRFFQAGASARRDLGFATLGTSLSVGSNAQHVTRQIGVTEDSQAKGDRSVLLVTNVVDLSRDFASGAFSWQPSVALGTSFLKHGNMTEKGAGPQSAVIHGANETHLWLEPSVSGRYSLEFGSGSTLRLFARFGVLQYLSGTTTKVDSGLFGAPEAASPARIRSDLDRTHFVGEAGLQYQVRDGLSLGLSYSQQDSDIREGGAGSLRFVLPLQ